MIITMIAVATVSLRVGQMDLGGLGADLTDEFAGGDFGHLLACFSLRIEKRPAGLSGRRGCGSLSARGRVFKVAVQHACPTSSAWR